MRCWPLPRPPRPVDDTELASRPAGLASKPAAAAALLLLLQAGAAAAGAGRFVSFLPGDNQDLSSPSSQEVLGLINGDLGELLCLPPGAFWAAVAGDESLHACLDSFLRFRR